jgi:ribosomal protein S18 acetylase RimI-like enzyme
MKTPEDMIVRPACQADLPTIASIHLSSWRDAYSGILPADYLAGQVQLDLQTHWLGQEILPQDVLLVADTISGSAGFVAVWCRPTAFVDSLHVLPAMRSVGIGSALMRAAIDQLVEMGHSTAYLWVLERNVAAISFYEGLGAMITRREAKNIFGHDIPSLRMEWSDLRQLA